MSDDTGGARSDPSRATAAAPVRGRDSAGRALGLASAGGGVALLLWIVWLYPRFSRLQAEGRLNEGDSEGCAVGLLAVASYLLGPLLALIALAPAIIALRRGERGVPIVAIALNLIAAVLLVRLFLH